MSKEHLEELKRLTFEDFKKEVLNDYRIGRISREVSLIGRKEVLTGKAKFGIFGDGKEVPQLALAKVFKPGDFRSGYYRDQTIVFATDMGTPEEFFAQLYANTDDGADPFSAGRQMNAHYATPLLDEYGEWTNHTETKNCSADTSPTASQMARGLGLALASKVYRSHGFKGSENFSQNGNEITFCTIGDASTSEGIFWESLNAAGVMQVPMVVSVWDDGYGISVPKKYQTTKGNISEILAGFNSTSSHNGVDIYEVTGWNYPELCELYEKVAQKTRETHIPVVIHVKELTQPQGHSTSGSHERYKSKDRLEWEKEYDCLVKMREWIIESAIAQVQDLEKIEEEAKVAAKEAQKAAWNAFTSSIKKDLERSKELLKNLEAQTSKGKEVAKLAQNLLSTMDPSRKDIAKALKRALWFSAGEDSTARDEIQSFLLKFNAENHERFNSYLYSNSKKSTDNIEGIEPVYSDDSPTLNGFEILNKFFDQAFDRDPSLLAFGEDLGKIGDVNQGFAGLQEKHGIERIFDTGIREASIMGQGIGLAMRGLRPIAEIQYLDYLIYGLQPLVDDLSTMQYRTKGKQKAPMIIRTRGHRLEGIWHTGSPIGMIINSIRGIKLCVPRNMTQAAGMYNTILKSDEPALVIECLNGYRLKEKLPDNLAEYTLPLGIPEIVKEGADITIVTYGSTFRVVEDAVEQLESFGISVELIDVRTLIPFDVNGMIGESVRKTSRLLIVDEDVPGSATGYILDQILKQNIFQYIDALPETLAAHDHRSAYASDGDYFCKPNAEDIFEKVYAIMHESDPDEFPEIYG